MSTMTERQRLLYTMLVVFISMLILTGVNFLLLRASERKWCDLFVLLDDGYNAPVQPGQPPLNERGKRIAAAIHERRTTLSCD